MMNKLILDTLKANSNLTKLVSDRIYFLKTSSIRYPCLIFSIYNERGELYSDDIEEWTGYYIQIDVYSKSNYSNIVEEVKKSLIGTGFKRKNEYDLWQNDLKLYHKGLRFFYLQEN